MTTKNNCCGDETTRIVLACSGGSNVGQMTNEAAKQLDIAGDAKFFCLAGVGGQIDAMVNKAKEVDKVIVLDGCPVGCAKKCANQAGLSGYHYLVATELGIEKKHDYNFSESDVARITQAVRQLLGICKCGG